MVMLRGVADGFKRAVGLSLPHEFPQGIVEDRELPVSLEAAKIFLRFQQARGGEGPEKICTRTATARTDSAVEIRMPLAARATKILSDIFRITFKLREIVLKLHRRFSGYSSATA